MGLREKVALLIIVLILDQVIYGEPVLHNNKLKSNKIRKNKAKQISKPRTKLEPTNRIFNFPEIEYPSAPMSTALFLKQNVNLETNQAPKLSNIQSLPKTDRLLKNRPKNRKRGYKINSKVGVIGTTPKVSLLTPFPEFTTTLKPFGFKDEDFPPVEYPLDATDLWTPHYWNRMPKFEPDIKINEEGFRLNSKATKKTSKIFKASPVKSKTLTSAQPRSFCNEDIYSYNDVSSVSQVTPSPIETTTSCPESIKTTPTPFIFYPLTTTSPTLQIANEYVCDDKVSLFTNITDFPSNISNNTSMIHTSKDVNIIKDDSQLADEMGYTVMYPEVLNSITTSTITPHDLYSFDKTWMYPELDNHTLNTYSDEIEQCYILIP